MVYHIVIIGGGNIGSKYFESLLTINRSIILSIIDPSYSAIQKNKKIFKKSKKNKHIRKVNFFKSINQLKENVFLAIISTNSDVRYKVILDLFKKISVKNIIVEKVPFQTNYHFKKIIQLTKKFNCKSWLNCVARLFPIYKKLKKKIIPNEKIIFQVSKGDFCLGSNSIHMIDLFLYFTGEKNIYLNSSNLDKKIYLSKRKKFLEIEGKLFGKTPKGNLLNIIGYHNSNLPFILILISRNQYHQVTLRGNKLILKSHEFKRKWMTYNGIFEFPKSSVILKKTVRKIIDEGKCDLASLEDSFNYHKTMLNCFTKHINKHNKIMYKNCPIT